MSLIAFRLQGLSSPASPSSGREAFEDRTSVQLFNSRHKSLKNRSNNESLCLVRPCCGKTGTGFRVGVRLVFLTPPLPPSPIVRQGLQRSEGYPSLIPCRSNRMSPAFRLDNGFCLLAVPRSLKSPICRLNVRDGRNASRTAGRLAAWLHGSSPSQPVQHQL